MKKLGILFLLFFTLNSFAQTENNPAVFSTSVEKVSDETYDLIFTVKKKPLLRNEYNLPIQKLVMLH